MSDYYRELYQVDDPTRMAGWRYRLEQVLRFEAVLDLLPPDATDLLDLGCGPGELFGYLQTTHRSRPYRGVDLFPPAVQVARLRFPGASFELSDWDDRALKPASVCVAIGSLVDGESTPGEWRLLRLGHLVRAAWRLGKRGFALVVLRQEWLDEMPGDPALCGARRGELQQLAKDLGCSLTLRDDLLTSSYIAWFGDARTETADANDLIQRVVSGPLGQTRSRIEHARLWLDCGRIARAEAILEASDAPTGSMADLLRERISLLKPGSSEADR